MLPGLILCGWWRGLRTWRATGQSGCLATSGQSFMLFAVSPGVHDVPVSLGWPVTEGVTVYRRGSYGSQSYTVCSWSWGHVADQDQDRNRVSSCLGRCSTTVKRHQDQGNSYKGKHWIGLQSIRVTGGSMVAWWHGEGAESPTSAFISSRKGKSLWAWLELLKYQSPRPQRQTPSNRTTPSYPTPYTFKHEVL